MKPFERLTGRAVVLYRSNIDTDVIIPARYLNTISRTGLGRYAFADLAVEPENAFEATRAGLAPILIAGENFGCGSSREHAVWALVDLGIRVIIAPSFADIFASNACRNGLLLVTLASHVVERLIHAGHELTIDLDRQTVTTEGFDVYQFAIEAHRKEHLRNGVDEIESTLATRSIIDAYEAKVRRNRPWTFT